MGINMERSMNAELAEGATDGVVRKKTGGMRGGRVDPSNNDNHAHLVGEGAGIIEGEWFESAYLQGIVRQP